MQTQLELRPVAQAHSRTSRLAAEAIEPASATLRGQVLQYLRDQGHEGATDEEMQNMLGMNPSTQRPRRIELLKLGLICDSGRVRNTSSGRKAVVWRAA